MLLTVSVFGLWLRRLGDICGTSCYFVPLRILFGDMEDFIYLCNYFIYHCDYEAKSGLFVYSIIL